LNKTDKNAAIVRKTRRRANHHLLILKQVQDDKGVRIVFNSVLDLSTALPHPPHPQSQTPHPPSARVSWLRR